jgi:hypothetical protein
MRFSELSGEVPTKDIGRPDTQRYLPHLHSENLIFLVGINVSFS